MVDRSRRTFVNMNISWRCLRAVSQLHVEHIPWICIKFSGARQAITILLLTLKLPVPKPNTEGYSLLLTSQDRTAFDITHVFSLKFSLIHQAFSSALCKRLNCVHMSESVLWGGCKYSRELSLPGSSAFSVAQNDPRCRLRWQVAANSGWSLVFGFFFF